MKRKNPNKYKQFLLRCVYAMAFVVMGFVFIIGTRAASDGLAYDETFYVNDRVTVNMSVAPNVVTGRDLSSQPMMMLPLTDSNVYAQSYEFVLGPFTASLPFILLSASWDESRAAEVTDVTLRVRTRNTNNDPWSAWQELERLKDFRDERDSIPGRVRTEPLIVDESQEFEAQLTLTTFDPRITPQMANLSFTAIGTESGVSESQSHKVTGEVRATINGTQNSETQKLQISSRASWGADESLRVSDTGEDLWPETHGEAKAFVIHNTGGTNGGSDPAATIRAIQRYHGKTLEI